MGDYSKDEVKDIVDAALAAATYGRRASDNKPSSNNNFTTIVLFVLGTVFSAGGAFLMSSVALESRLVKMEKDIEYYKKNAEILGTINKNMEQHKKIIDKYFSTVDVHLKHTGEDINRLQIQIRETHFIATGETLD